MKQAVIRILIICTVTLGVQFGAGATPEAAWADEVSESPVYIGIGPAIGFDKFRDTGGIDFDEAYGLNYWVGLRLVDFISAELNLEYLEGFDFSASGADVDAQVLAFTWNAKIFPLSRVITGRIDPFVYAGIGVGWVELNGNSAAGKVDETAFIARFGGGLDLYLTEHLAFQVSSSYVLPTGRLDDTAYVSLVFGLQYRWEQPPRP